MSFGFSAGDFLLLIQLAKATYKSCVEAGTEYNEIAREIRSLHSILKPLRDEAEKPESGLFRQDQGSAAELVKAIDGCKHILEDLQILLAKYEGLSTTSETVSAPKKLWHRFRFSSKIEQLSAVRGKLISYTSTISVLLDGVQLRATGRVEDKLDNVSSQMTEGFESLKKAILGMAVKSRAEQRGGSTMSLLSLSTYAEDDKEVWQEFRRELVALGFRSKALDRHKDLLQAYMLKLDQSGLLDEVEDSSVQNIAQPWYKKQAFLETVTSLPGLQPIYEEESASQLQEPPQRPPEYSINDRTKDLQLSTPAQASGPTQYDSELSSAFGPPSHKEADASMSKEKRDATSFSVALADLPWPTESDESEKETSGLKRPRRVRKVRRSEYRASDTDSVRGSSDSSGLNGRRGVGTNSKPEGKITTADRVVVAAEIVTESASGATQNPVKDKDEHRENFDPDRSSTERLVSHSSDTVDLHAAETEIDARLEPLYGSPSRNTSTRDQGEPLPSPNISPPSPISGPVNLKATFAAAAASSKDANQTSSRSPRSHNSLQDGATLAIPRPREPVTTEQSLDQTPSNLISDVDVPQVRHTETSSSRGVGEAVQDFKMPESRRKKAVTNPKDRIAKDWLLHDFEIHDMGQTASRTQEISGKIPSIIRTQSSKSRRATAKASPARPFFGQIQTDPIPRLKTVTKVQPQERLKDRTGKSTSSSGLGAVVLGLAGLSVILGLRKRDRTGSARRGRSYVSDNDYYSDIYDYDTYDYDTYDSFVTDSEDEGSFFGNTGRKKTKGGSLNKSSGKSGGKHEVIETRFRKPKDSTKDVRSRPSDVSNAAPEGNAVQANVEASQDSQNDPQSASTGKKTLSAYMESASESNPDLSVGDRVTKKGPLASVKLDPGPATHITHKETDSSNASGPDAERHHKMDDELEEKLHSMNTSHTSREVSLPVVQEVNTESRFILPNRSSSDTNVRRNPVKITREDFPSITRKKVLKTAEEEVTSSGNTARRRRTNKEAQSLMETSGGLSPLSKEMKEARIRRKQMREEVRRLTEEGRISGMEEDKFKGTSERPRRSGDQQK